MNREIIPFVSEEQWLAERAKDLTSTDAASLCGVGRRTRYQLWREKRAGEVVAFEENEAMRLGKILEAPIAEHIACENGMEIEPFKSYMRLPDLRLGSSFDYVAKDRSYLLEIKLVGPQQFRNGWTVSEFGIEAPLDQEAQIQQEMLVSGIPLAFFGVLVGTETHLLRRELDEPVAERLQREARAFWTEDCPAPNWEIDADFVIALNRQSSAGKTITASEDVDELMELYKRAQESEAEAAKVKKSYKAQILEAIGDAERVEGLSYNLSAKMIGDAEIAAYTRRGYRDFRIMERKS